MRHLRWVWGGGGWQWGLCVDDWPAWAVLPCTVEWLARGSLPQPSTKGSFNAPRPPPPPYLPPFSTSPATKGTTCPWLCAGCVCAYARLVPFGAGDERGRGGGLGTGACVRAAGLPHPEVPRSVVLWLPCWVPSCQSHQLGRGCGGCRLMTRAPGSCMGRRGSGVGGQRVCATGAARRHCCRAPVLFLSSAARHLPGGKRFCLVHVCPWVSCTVSCTVS
jgi:hypothetical protein